MSGTDSSCNTDGGQVEAPVGQEAEDNIQNSLQSVQRLDEEVVEAVQLSNGHVDEGTDEVPVVVDDGFETEQGFALELEESFQQADDLHFGCGGRLFIDRDFQSWDGRSRNRSCREEGCRFLGRYPEAAWWIGRRQRHRNVGVGKIGFCSIIIVVLMGW